jgi:hypothetical protein
VIYYKKYALKRDKSILRKREYSERIIQSLYFGTGVVLEMKNRP